MELEVAFQIQNVPSNHNIFEIRRLHTIKWFVFLPEVNFFQTGNEESP